MSSTFQCEDFQCFTFKRCDKFKLKCTSHGGMYSTHYFGKIRVTSTQQMLLRRVLTGKYNRFVLKFQGVAVNQS